MTRIAIVTGRVRASVANCVKQLDAGAGGKLDEYGLSPAEPIGSRPYAAPVTRPCAPSAWT
ncbi:MAG: hypothetical protein ACLTSX_01705 [Collinsella sp.]